MQRFHTVLAVAHVTSSQQTLLLEWCYLCEAERRLCACPVSACMARALCGCRASTTKTTTWATTSLLKAWKTAAQCAACGRTAPSGSPSGVLPFAAGSSLRPGPQSATPVPSAVWSLGGNPVSKHGGPCLPVRCCNGVGCLENRGCSCGIVLSQGHGRPALPSRSLSGHDAYGMCSLRNRVSDMPWRCEQGVGLARGPQPATPHTSCILTAAVFTVRRPMGTSGNTSTGYEPLTALAHTFEPLNPSSPLLLCLAVNLGFRHNPLALTS